MKTSLIITTINQPDKNIQLFTKIEKEIISKEKIFLNYWIKEIKNILRQICL